MAEIADVTVQFDDGSRVTLQQMWRHCRPERVQDLIEDIELLCEDVLGRRKPEDKRPRLRAVRGQQ
jgi:hypothetical protein